MKSPSVSVGWHRCFTRSFRRFECFWLFNFKTGHEPVELLPGQLLYFQLISGPAESALDFHTFIQQHKSVRLPEQSFDPVTTFSTEEIQGASPWIHMELILYNSTQPVNRFPHIRSACYDQDEMSVKRSFDTHLIPGLLRSYAAPAILQIFEIR